MTTACIQLHLSQQLLDINCSSWQPTASSCTSANYFLVSTAPNDNHLQPATSWRQLLLMTTACSCTSASYLSTSTAPYDNHLQPPAPQSPSTAHHDNPLQPSAPQPATAWRQLLFMTTTFSHQLLGINCSSWQPSSARWASTSYFLASTASHDNHLQPDEPQLATSRYQLLLMTTTFIQVHLSQLPQGINCSS